MKNLKEYIIESQNFLVNKKLNNRQDKYEYHPTNRDELIDIVVDLLKKGITDLNCIDVSNITNMCDLFYNVNFNNITLKDINISEWDVSNVTNMTSMFSNCKVFNSDLSRWNVSNVEYMNTMFKGCEKFNSDLSKWDVSKVKYMCDMFKGCEKFNSDLSKWDVSNVKLMVSIFNGCTTLKKNNNIPKWYTGEV